ncbi:MAG: antitoxin Xre/MbcA/ParS toxin-binding domain-containing protein [Pricia sp.]
MEKKYVSSLIDKLTEEGHNDTEILSEVWQQLKHPTSVREPSVIYSSPNTETSPVMFDIIDTLRKGLPYKQFEAMTKDIPLDREEWKEVLHLSRRTMTRYKDENRVFETKYAERIFEIRMLYDFGVEVFGNKEKFHTWLSRENVVLGKVVPKTLLDTTIGIDILRDQLGRIDYGILA